MAKVKMAKAPGKLCVGFLYDDSLDKTDGVAQYVKTLGQWLSDQGHQVFYMVGQTQLKSWAGGRVYSLSKNQAVNFNGNSVTTPLPANRRRIRQVLAEQQPDILHVQVPYSPFMAGRVIFAAPKQVAVVGTFHIFPVGILALAGTKLLRFACWRSLRRFETIVSVSLPAAKFARSSFGVETRVVPNMIDLNKFKSSTPQRAKHIVFLGRLVPRKGARQLVEAFIILKRSVSDATLDIAGDGPERLKLETMAKAAGLGSSVRFLGFIKEEDKTGILASAHIACFPSLGGESFGIVLLEAMAAGAGVVVGGNNPGYASVLGKDSVALVNPRDSSTFAARLEKLLVEPGWCAKLHKEQQKLVQQYDVGTVGNQLMEVYMGAIASRRQKT